MKSTLPKSFKEGDELTASIVNGIIGEIWRWRAIQAAPPLYVSQTYSDAPPYISFRSELPSAWGTTPSGGYTLGSITTPVSNTATVVMYPIPGNTTSSFNVTPTWSVYSGTVAASKIGLYQLFADGKWYIITADC